MYKLIQKEEFVSVQSAQTGIAKACQQAEKKGVFLRVMRNNQPVGVLLPEKFWQQMLTDMQLLLETVNNTKKVLPRPKLESKAAQLSMIDLISS